MNNKYFIYSRYVTLALIALSIFINFSIFSTISLWQNIIFAIEFFMPDLLPIIAWTILFFFSFIKPSRLAWGLLQWGSLVYGLYLLRLFFQFLSFGDLILTRWIFLLAIMTLCFILFYLLLQLQKQVPKQELEISTPTADDNTHVQKFHRILLCIPLVFVLLAILFDLFDGISRGGPFSEILIDLFYSSYFFIGPLLFFYVLAGIMTWIQKSLYLNRSSKFYRVNNSLLLILIAISLWAVYSMNTCSGKFCEIVGMIVLSYTIPLGLMQIAMYVYTNSRFKRVVNQN